ncbi:MAG TPA: benzoate/H(+) symporter BenE family transporter, partial [Candidatus Udaeobacter sp.]|nr:benzoate/H(+) symporter BenE family transporter [Candidatus Udaeobacter sp.]
GTGAGLTQEQLASWVFGVFFVNGAITLVMSWIYSQPLCFFWTIPGTVLVGSSLHHLSFPEVIGALCLLQRMSLHLALVLLSQKSV